MSLAASLLLGGAALVAATRSGESSTSSRTLRPYVHEGEWETKTIVETLGQPPVKGHEAEIQRDCLTAAKAEMLLRQCREEGGCRGRPCREKLEPLGPHAARIQIACPTARGEAVGDFTYRWDSWEGTVEVIRDGRALLSIRMSGMRLSDCR